MRQNTLSRIMFLSIFITWSVLFFRPIITEAQADVAVFDALGRPVKHGKASSGSNSSPRAHHIRLLRLDQPQILDDILAEEKKSGKPQPSIPVAVLLGRSKEDLAALLKSGSDINEIHPTFGTALFQAIFQKGDRDVFAFLLQSGADPNLASPPYGGLPLEEAVDQDMDDWAGLLVEAGARFKNPDIKKPEKTLFHKAVSNGMLETVRLMLEAGANPNEPRHYSDGRPTEPPIFLTRSPQMLRLLFAAGAKANARNQYGQNALAALSWTEDNIPTAIALLEGGVSGTHSSVLEEHGDTPIHYAIRFDSHELFQAARQAGVSVTKRDEDKVTPLLEAVRREKAWFVRELLAAGAPIQGSATYPGQVFADEDSFHLGTDDLLAQAVETGNLEVVQILIEAGVALNTRSNTYFQGTALHLAIEAEREDMVETLLKAKARTNVTDGYGSTPLETAIHRDNVSIVEMLLKAGANPKVKDEDGATMLEIAIAYERNPKIIKLLENTEPR